MKVHTTSQDAMFKKLTSDLAHNPHGILGLHQVGDKKIIRLYRPKAKECLLELHGSIVSATRIHPEGLFECAVPIDTTHLDYRIYHQNGLLSYDPYAFWPTFSDVDQHLFGRAVHYNLHRQMGARLCTHDGVKGVKFTVWAPNAEAVSLVADFNHFNGRANPMRSLGGCGIWELFIPGLREGEKYKFEIKAKGGSLRIKADPYALHAEVRPHTASIVADIDSFQWRDHDWMTKRREMGLNRPMSIYEVHLGSWKRKNGQFMRYPELAVELAAYCKEMGFTHVELLPIAEHPFDESWGYQVTGFLSVTSRFGTPREFQYFVDYLHQAGIGVLVDFVPGHFPADDFSLRHFDGTALYEHQDPRQGFHPHWSTHIFNFGRSEVVAFLMASALVWLDVYHIDGLRVDAVASMLYLDYGRHEGEWIPNKHGGKENLDAIEFLKHMNSIVHDRFPGVVTIAEESTSFTGVTHPLSDGGLGFDCKWNMGWMNDTLRFFSKDPIYRHYHHNDLTFGLLYAFSEKFTLVLSHDEVVHGKGSLLSKMSGDYWQKFANFRLLYTYMMCMSGKKLIFMGAEIGQWNEWNCNGSVEWQLTQFPIHSGLQRMVKELNHIYIQEPALWDNDFSHSGFEWVDFHDVTNSVLSFRRKPLPWNKGASELLCVFNCTPQYHDEYVIYLSNIGHIEEVFNSDRLMYGGSGKADCGVEILRDTNKRAYGLRVRLAPLAGLIFRLQFE